MLLLSSLAYWECRKDQEHYTSLNNKPEIEILLKSPGFYVNSPLICLKRLFDELYKHLSKDRKIHTFLSERVTAANSELHKT